MWIDPKTERFGIPSVALRDALRSSGQMFSEEHLGARLNLTPRRTRKLVNDMLCAGWLEVLEPSLDGLVLTVDGAQFRNATAARPVHRATADRLVRELLDRVEVVQKSSEYLYSVANIKVFGSYLSQAPRLGDVDLCVVLSRKYDEHRQVELERRQICQALTAGRRFQNIVDELFWPQTRVFRFLRHRSRVLSFHHGDDPVLEQTKWTNLYPPSTR